MLYSGIYRVKDTEAKNVLESVVCCQNIQHIVCLQNALNKMCIGLFNMALAASEISSALNGGDLPGKISEELLVCKICFGRFNQRKLPKLLACSHTFCEPCVRQYHSINAINGLASLANNDDDDAVFLDSHPNYNNFPCPICRKLTQLPESGVEGLANNFTVLSLMEILIDRKRSQVDGLKDNSDTCSVKSDVIGIIHRDPKKKRRERRRGSCCSVFSVPTEVASSMTSLLEIPSVDAKCAICDRRFPESEFPCGHCVCTKCFVAAQRNNNDESENKEAKETEDLVNEQPNCPACAQHVQSDDSYCINGASSIVLHNGPGPPADYWNQNNNCVVNECQQQSSNYSTPTQRADPTEHIYPNLAVETLDSLGCSGSRSRGMSCTCRRNGATGPGRVGIIPDDRPPPYNPGLYFNGNGHSDQQSVSLSSNGSSRNGSPRRAPPGHRYSASVIADINHIHDSQASNIATTASTTTGPSSLAFSNPTYSCGAAAPSARPSTGRDMNPCDRPPPHAPERPPPETPHHYHDHQDLYNVSQCSGHTYDCASNLSHHSYESPYALRGSQSFRPPIPPRRHSSSPGGISVKALRQHLAMKKRSESAPSAPSAPPSQEKSNDSETYQSPSSLYGVSPPVPPTRRIYDSPHSSPVKCVKKFGKYSEVRMQTSTFRQPTKVAQSEKGDIVVVDEQQMTVQVFTYAGDYLSMFKVIGVQGASFFSADKLAIATHRGISIFTMAGELIKELSTGLSVNTFPYKFGFVVATPKSVQIYRQSLTLVKEISKRKTTKSHLFNKLGKKQPDPGLFENLRDITVLTNKQIAVLDSGKGTIHVIDEEGTSKMTINPALETCGKLADAESLTADPSNNLYVADTGNQRVLRFTNHGTYSKTILNCKATAADKRLSPYGVVITDIGNLVVSLAGENSAEVRIYTLQ